MRTRDLLQLLNKFAEGSETGKSAKVQIVSRANWKYPQDIKEIKLVENKLIGANESHRLFILID